MARKAVFAGLVVDEYGQQVTTAFVGQEPCYVVDDEGFKRHIPSEDVDRQVLTKMREQIQGHEDLLTDQAAKMLGQEDIFSRAILKEQLKNIDQQFEEVLQAGIPEEARAYLGMTGFKITINHHGDVIDIQQPEFTTPDE